MICVFVFIDCVFVFIALRVLCSLVCIFYVCVLVLTPEKSEMVATGDPDNTEADNPLFPTTTQQMEDTIQWCVNKPSGLPKQVRASEDNEL